MVTFLAADYSDIHVLSKACHITYSSTWYRQPLCLKTDIEQLQSDLKLILGFILPDIFIFVIIPFFSLWIYHLSLAWYISRPSYSLDFIIIIELTPGEENTTDFRTSHYETVSSRNSLHLRSNILFSTLFWNTPNLYSSLDVIPSSTPVQIISSHKACNCSLTELLEASTTTAWLKPITTTMRLC
jgi:hypothetical protein